MDEKEKTSAFAKVRAEEKARGEFTPMSEMEIRLNEFMKSVKAKKDGLL